MINIKTDHKYALVFTHNDIDGLMAGFAVKYEMDNNFYNEEWERNVDVVLCGYGDTFNLSFFKNKTQEFIEKTKKADQDALITVFMLDYAIQPNDETLKFFNFVKQYGCEFVWCDHHITAIQNLDHYNFKGIRDVKKAGCMCTLEYLKNEKLTNTSLYKMANDFDLWRLEQTEFGWKKQVLPFSFLLQSYDFKTINDNKGILVSVLRQFVEDDSILENMVKVIGRPIYDYNLHQAEKHSSNCYIIDWNGYKCLVINSLNSNSYEFENHPEYSNADLLVKWTFIGDKYKFDIYTCSDEMDVGELCEKYFNGGGHRKSGGGSSSENPFFKISSKEE